MNPNKVKTMYDKLFSGINLPVKPAIAVDGATISVIEEPADIETPDAFFGGYAEGGLLDDMGFEALPEAPAEKPARK
jgi:hypothetical protein